MSTDIMNINENEFYAHVNKILNKGGPSTDEDFEGGDLVSYFIVASIIYRST